MDWKMYIFAVLPYILVSYTCKRQLENLKRKMNRVFCSSRNLKMKPFYFLTLITTGTWIFLLVREEIIVSLPAGRCKTVYSKMTGMVISPLMQVLLEII